jgi:hypothetical protein
MAAPMNALTIDPMVNTAKIMLKLRPIKAANPCKHNCAVDFVGLLANT